MATTTVSGVQYSGIWTMQQVNAAVAANTWPIAYGPQGLWSWGSNGLGKLGLGNLTAYSSPKQIGSLTAWKSISAGDVQSLAIKLDGTLWSWGAGNSGVLGLGNTTNYSSPKQVGALTSWLKVSAGYDKFNLATKTDGTLWAWGKNNNGQLGLSNTTYYSSPKQIGSGTTWSDIAAAGYCSLAIKTDGTLWSWGYNGAGQLGLGNTTSYSSPKQVGALTTWSKVNGGIAHSLAIKTDGTLWSWGDGAYGKLGLGNTTYYSSPKQVGALTTWSNSVGATYRTLAVKTDGTLWSWGFGYEGELGLGNTTDYSSPKQIGALTSWAIVPTGCGNTFSMAIKTDKTLWVWGRNAGGYLGLGNTTSYSSPKQVGSLTTWLNISNGSDSTLAIQTA